jgi:hypothetical protein
MRIVNVTTGDTGNQSYLLSKAINENTRHRSRSFIRQTYFEWPHDVMWRPEWDGKVPKWIQKWWQKADIVHLHNRWQKAKYWAASPHAGWVVHQHGRWPDRDRYALELDVDRERHAIRVVSTLNLLSDVGWRLDRWFPRPIETILEPKMNWGSPLHVIQAPTVKSRKGTAAFVSVMKELSDRYNVTYEVVTKRPHLECMIHKARADICFDQLSPCFGTNALEAWALGIPVVTGLSPKLDQFVRKKVAKNPPYVLATTKNELYEAMERLIVNTSYRSQMAERGNAYVRRWHTPTRCAEIALTVYEEAINQ